MQFAFNFVKSVLGLIGLQLAQALSRLTSTLSMPIGGYQIPNICCSDLNISLGLGVDRLYRMTDCCRLPRCIASKLHH